MSIEFLRLSIVGAAGGCLGIGCAELASRMPMWLARRWDVPVGAVLHSGVGLSSGACRVRSVAAGCVMAALAAWLTVRFGVSVRGLAALAFAAGMCTLAMIDLETRLLPDVISLPFAVAGVLLNALHVFASPSLSVVGFLAGWLILMLPHWGAKVLRGTEGMGRGDAKMLAAIGAWLGACALADVLVISIVAAFAVAAWQALARVGQRGDAIAFGFPLAIGSVATLCCWPFAAHDCVTAALAWF
jgi:prepilin signal peptidase PulO-like enzyme (type II secretory pathway)